MHYYYYVTTLDQLDNIWAYGICEPKQLDLFSSIQSENRRIHLHQTPQIARQQIMLQLTHEDREDEMDRYILLQIDASKMNPTLIIHPNSASIVYPHPIDAKAITKVEPVQLSLHK